ncbi:tRNA lysidine(34) synthetase TilS [Nitrosovibrio sp. Nv17]|uniref:tRNA lysidine(34) synthetase TilS n=1 Tax=Nitrosovibrio sp. Nv17 TaxID=1855339 RepID=UPI00090906C4|nr:tRNA lysidine(34) synthetase TilS [Nitrosovibrio sp. Nv17]SFW36975.1 tRNA(Ile)-lysidine synthase [Nitrosovibrio sp. Nv17]
MAGSRKLVPDSLPHRVEEVLRGQVRPGDRLAAALSGGVDSVVLLDLLAEAAGPLGFSLSAVHVDHGISPHAGRWSRFCRRLCRTRGIPIVVARPPVVREPGASLEAAARDARYGVFARLDADYVVLAHHLDDQAETLLLQLLRGAGAKGLGAMPVVREVTPAYGPQAAKPLPRLLRPMLDVPRRAIENHARARALAWIVDESNGDTAFDRNFLRHELLPLLERRFPAYRATLARASRHLAEAAGLLDELAAADGEAHFVADGLRVEALRELAPARARNLLRHFLARQGAVPPSTVALGEMLRQLRSAGAGSRLRLAFGDREVRCFRGVVRVREAARAAATAGGMPRLAWQGEGRLVLADCGGSLRFLPRSGAGISLRKLTEHPVTVRRRQGGERLRPDCARPRRSLKNLLREAALPPWEREALPLIFSGEHLVCVPGIGVDCRFRAADGEPGIVVEWDAAAVPG